MRKKGQKMNFFSGKVCCICGKKQGEEGGQLHEVGDIGANPGEEKIYCTHHIPKEKKTVQRELAQRKWRC